VATTAGAISVRGGDLRGGRRRGAAQMSGRAVVVSSQQPPSALDGDQRHGGWRWTGVTQREGNGYGDTGDTGEPGFDVV
jgi:hypothetical protein